MNQSRADSIAIAMPDDSTTFTQVLTPHSTSKATDSVTAPPPATRLVYTSAALALLMASHFGWCLSQVNLTKFNSQADCDARPVKPGTCHMFPGHSRTEWFFVVNAWIVGGMIGAICSAHISDRCGRKRTLMADCLVMITAAVIQASAPNLSAFVVGRFVAGVASGTATALCNGYISEVAPPHLGAQLGSGYGLTIAAGIFLVDVSFFFADSASGWRYIGGFPIVIAGAFLFFCRDHMVESPSWLLIKGRQDEAEQVLARLYGQENVVTALKWIIVKPVVARSESAVVAPSTSPFVQLLSKDYRRQVVLAVHLALAVQFTGVNAVFFYSSVLFKTAGVKDGRVGSMIVGCAYLLPTFVVAVLTRRFGNRKMLLTGQAVMLLAATGLTLALSFHVSALSILFIALYAFSFSASLGALAYPTGSSLYPDALRATGTSLMMVVNWLGTLAIGVGFPYVSTALDELAFLPFVGTIVYFIFFTFKSLPNTTGKTNEEIQQLFRSE
ncbi:hypothetical protein Poli38472_001159 [Pythium oligandrum]|uniref:Hexose transporter 1 n=1 Tax=Pythium oligandrum TaxID=41045 RepID=A0A8K1CU49_PYTOL|nr:hypothetical protein Poli38472_001159 [Pythium oligandrum]|eukprot:TMW69003.1 hypothetical protein Poli38472_001159 [Pythium oligandrum]